MLELADQHILLGLRLPWLVHVCGCYRVMSRYKLQLTTNTHDKWPLVGCALEELRRSLNEHAPYKRGVVRPKWRSQKLFDMHKTWPSKHLSEQHRKSSQNHAYSSCFGYKTVAIQLFYKKVDTVARAGTCDSCFRRAIADVKKSDEYHLL